MRLGKAHGVGGWPHIVLCPGLGGGNSSEASLPSLPLPRGGVLVGYSDEDDKQQL